MRKDKTIQEFALEYKNTVVVLILVLALVLLALIFLKSEKALITVVAHDPETVVIVDDGITAVSATSTEHIRQEVISGSHTVLISKEGSWPWYKELQIKRGEERILYPFLIPKENAVVEIPETTAGYSILANLADSPTTRAHSQDGSTRIETDGRNIKAFWRSKDKPHPYYFCEEGTCKDSFTVLESTTPIQDIVFLPGYNNVVVFASGSTVFAIELDRSGTQNFQPIYTGTLPYVYRNKESLYISDNNTLYLVRI